MRRALTRPCGEGANPATSAQNRQPAPARRSPTNLPAPNQADVPRQRASRLKASSITRALARAREKLCITLAGYTQHNDDYDNHSDLGGVATTVRT
jgi:hypothetical protein